MAKAFEQTSVARDQCVSDCWKPDTTALVDIMIDEAGGVLKVSVNIHEPVNEEGRAAKRNDNGRVWSSCVTSDDTSLDRAVTGSRGNLLNRFKSGQTVGNGSRIGVEAP